MGVAGFCLLAIVGLLPAGLTSNRNSSALSAAANIAQAIVADLHSTKCAGNNDSSPQYAIRFSAAGAQVTYFSDDGCLTSSPPAGGYQATTTINTNSIPASITIKITWPALISPASASDAFEITTVIDR